MCAVITVKTWRSACWRVWRLYAAADGINGMKARNRRLGYLAASAATWRMA
jgi:hypothetical protein